MIATLANLVRGGLIGAAEVIPGVSGGTVALLVGLYRRLIDAAAQVVWAVRRLLGLGGGRPSARDAGHALRAVPWGLLIPVGIGMVVALVLGARLLEPLLEEYPVQMRGLFFGLVLAGIVVPVRMVMRTAPGAWRIGDALLALVAAAAAFVLTGLPPREITDPGPVLIMVSAALAVCVLVLPGVSGSFLLLSIGVYGATIAALNDRNLGYIALFAIGAVLGLSVFVSVLQWLLHHRTRITLVIVSGLMAGSLRALWPWQGPERELLAPGDPLAAPILLALVGAVAVFALLWLEHRFQSTEEDVDFGPRP